MGQLLKIDICTIFPDFFEVTKLSLIGRAQVAGLLQINAHDLREYTHDRHRMVDDTPYGGGAGMVMLPEPWGEALDTLLGPQSLLVVPSPAGELFKQSVAHELATEDHLVFACGRYEGIDQRVVDFYTEKGRVRQLSVGDYVLTGGEVAAMAIIEAVTRLIPGMLGNPNSLIEESHEGGFLEYPSYTRPALWRGLEVPSVLLSGNHVLIAKWRHEQQLMRTRMVRPELLD